MLKKILKWTAIGWAVIIALLVLIALIAPTEDVELKDTPAAAEEEKKKPDSPMSEMAKKSTEKQIADVLHKDDVIQFNKENGFLFIKAPAVGVQELVAKEKLRKTVKAIAQFDEIDRVVINVQGPGGSPLLIKYWISGEKLRAIDFEIPGYDNILYSADKFTSHYDK